MHSFQKRFSHYYKDYGEKKHWWDREEEDYFADDAENETEIWDLLEEKMELEEMIRSARQLNDYDTEQDTLQQLNEIKGRITLLENNPQSHYGYNY